MAVASAALRAPVAIGDLAVIRCCGGRVDGGGRPAAGVPGRVAGHQRRHGGRRRPGAAAEGGAGRAPSWRSR
ncbi:hypothetical protein LJR269_006590 [Duganella sp. LjRoot269]